jgi:hypothetical protein
MGSKIVAVSDSTGGVYCTEGLNPYNVRVHKNKTGTVQGLEGATNISNAELLTSKCDILVPAALENQLTKANAGKIKPGSWRKAPTDQPRQKRTKSFTRKASASSQGNGPSLVSCIVGHGAP